MNYPNSIYTFIRAFIADIDQKRVIGTASNLTYSSLLAFVPILAVFFAVARGFGYSVYIEDWFRDLLSSQPDAAETIIGFVNSYLVHTKKGIFLGIGLLFMLWTTLMLISNIESAFNDIWHVKHPRSIFRTITDYVSLFFLLPIFLVVSSGLSIWVTALQDQLSDVIVLGPIMTFFIELSPYILLSAGFVCLYVFMPNTKVKFSSALWPGVLAGICMQIFQMVYINSQIWISNYNAIYGSFAMIPFFLLWLQTSWIICLMGAELTYCKQNSEDFFSNEPSETSGYSFNTRLELSWTIMEHIAERFSNGEDAYTAEEIKEMLNADVVARGGSKKIPMKLVDNLLSDLQDIHFLAELVHDEKGDTARYLPNEALKNLTKEELYNRLSNLGVKI
ncbi:MAG: YihY/virulence factor BrkB family protein [Prevotella sp.]|nr:YihY/virulence factor BrkB family protein [Prevotella sp.]MBR4521737.1 YihY/virulence factor BrkB family protein [Prevotella sp.]